VALPVLAEVALLVRLGGARWTGSTPRARSSTGRSSAPECLPELLETPAAGKSSHSGKLGDLSVYVKDARRVG